MTPSPFTPRSTTVVAVEKSLVEKEDRSAGAIRRPSHLRDVESHTWGAFLANYLIIRERTQYYNYFHRGEPGLIVRPQRLRAVPGTPRRVDRRLW